MSYTYGPYDSSARSYGGVGSYGNVGVQEYDRHRGGGARIGGNDAFGAYSGDRGYDRGGYNVSYGTDYGRDHAARYNVYGYGGGMGGGRGSYGHDHLQVNSGGAHLYGYPNFYFSAGDYGRHSEQEPYISKRRSAGIAGGAGSGSRKYYDTTDRSYGKYRNKRDTSSSSSSSDDGEGVFERMGNKIKGVFGYGPDADNNDQQQYNSSSRRGDRYNTGSSHNKYNTGGYNDSYGGGYGGGDNIVSLRGRREIAPSHVSEESGSKQLVWQINAKGFDLDNIKVADAGNNKIEITGHAEDVGQHHRRTKQFTRVITLPEGSNAKEVKSRISGNGLLTLTVPYTGKGLHNYGTRELQVGQGSNLVGGTTTTGSRTSVGNTTSSANKNENFATSGTVGSHSSTSTNTTRSTTHA